VGETLRRAAYFIDLSAQADYPAEGKNLVDAPRALVDLVRGSSATKSADSYDEEEPPG
jgi:hypothetical protein